MNEQAISAILAFLSNKIHIFRPDQYIHTRVAYHDLRTV